jgi:hypothetical protein
MSCHVVFCISILCFILLNHSLTLILNALYSFSLPSIPYIVEESLPVNAMQELKTDTASCYITSKSISHHNNSFLSTLIVGEGVDDHGGPYRAALHTAVGEEPPGFLQLLTPCVNSKSDSGVLCGVLLRCVVLWCDVSCRVVLHVIMLYSEHHETKHCIA